MYNIPICIAKILIELISPLSAAELGIEKRLGPFFYANEKPLLRVNMCWQENAHPSIPHGTLIFDLGSIWKMYQFETDWYAALIYRYENCPGKIQGILHANLSWNALTLTEHRNGFNWQSLLNIGAGELILRTTILFSGGLMFHASGLDDNGRGIVFIGHSGAGKSTQLDLWSNEPGVIAMNDDRIAVRVEADVPMCYGTPWGGKDNIISNHAAPLSALFILEQSLENSVELLAPAVAAPLLATRAFLPYWNHALMRQGLENLNNIIDQVPIYRLRCRPNPDAISIVRSVL